MFDVHFFEKAVSNYEGAAFKRSGGLLGERSGTALRPLLDSFYQTISTFALATVTSSPESRRARMTLVFVPLSMR